jgi:hypothetical protein
MTCADQKQIYVGFWEFGTDPSSERAPSRVGLDAWEDGGRRTSGEEDLNVRDSVEAEIRWLETGYRKSPLPGVNRRSARNLYAREWIGGEEDNSHARSEEIETALRICSSGVTRFHEFRRAPRVPWSSV